VVDPQRLHRADRRHRRLAPHVLKTRAAAHRRGRYGCVSATT
jgi:hypothetical protein